MKKFLLFSILSIVTFTASVIQSSAQAVLISASYGNAKDTVVNTGSKVLYTKISGYKETITIIVSLTRISGTLGGTLKPVISSDGVNWYDATGFTTSDSAYTVTNVASQGKAYQCKRGYQYYGVQWTGSGTMSGSFTGVLLARKPTD